MEFRFENSLKDSGYNNHLITVGDLISGTFKKEIKSEKTNLNKLKKKISHPKYLDSMWSKIYLYHSYAFPGVVCIK